MPAVVRVVKMSGLRINAPLTRFHVGATVPLYITSNPEDGFLTPFSFANANPGLTFNWKAANTAVLKVQSVYDEVYTCDHVKW